ncbi:flavin monoamine oxidase family protein [Nocardia alba]|uniref:Monoamine oxidase n=1 Tax=Nocardia alba TaxID=225051 RepID=A0A4R1FSE4_9NOCA|nr:FAD-dependent oxidoreductase [Nocardia alba]TCJ97180.1 monoamine oxidase [Nocardia alba]
MAVLEAADRVGGRALTEKSSAGTALDLGAQWIGHDHVQMATLAREFARPLFPTPQFGKSLVLTHRGPVRLSPLTVAATGWALLRLELIARTTVRAGWDRVTLAEFVARIPGARAQRLTSVVLSEAFSCDPGEISVAAVVHGIRSVGGLRVMLSTAGGAQQSLLTGGAGALAQALADELGSAVRLNHRVSAIERSPAGVVVRSSAGTMAAERVVVAVPPPVAAMIEHRPTLPGERRHVQQNTVMGTIYKAIAVYRSPFWRGQGLSGESIGLDGPLPSTFDVSPPAGAGHLCILAPGESARALDRLTAEVRRDALLREVARHFGSGALEPVDWHEKSWHTDPFVMGGYSAFPRPGHLDALMSAASPTGSIHWAGTETARRCNGYLEGAVESGKRAALEVLTGLGAQP